MYQKINNNNFILTMKKYINIGCIIFDIDGVLIDVTKSYNEAIKNTIQFVVGNLTKKNNLKDLVTNKIILISRVFTIEQFIAVFFATFHQLTVAQYSRNFTFGLD